MAITRERAEVIARAQACVSCKEYSYRKVSLRPPLEALRIEFGEAWHAVLTCGICGTQQELGIDDDGDVLYVT